MQPKIIISDFAFALQSLCGGNAGLVPDLAEIKRRAGLVPALAGDDYRLGELFSNGFKFMDQAFNWVKLIEIKMER